MSTAQEALLDRPDTSGLPGDVQVQVNTFYAALQAAQGAYNILAQGYPQIWESGQYPTEYRRQQAELFMERVFEKQGTDLHVAEAALKAAWDAVREGLTPPLLGDPTTHQVMLLNAREDLRAALEGVTQPLARLEIVRDLLSEALESKRDPGMVYLLAATPALKRYVRSEEFYLGDFSGLQEDALKRILPPESLAYFAARPVLEQLKQLMESAYLYRGFVAKDNGLRVSMGEGETL
ncbi:hypothetical protein [uncultured Deinococcus sp.]|uniref:hypothetical protein n=1 Tax=uncultured Deinococcus sp. TaxID=158789 RepID=UPI002584FC3F|nr:hypothetical protein [uncultured Deinococcus sp.]